MTIHVAHGQLLVDMLDELRALRADLAHHRLHLRHLLLMMVSDCPLAFCPKKGEYTCR